MPINEERHFHRTSCKEAVSSYAVSQQRSPQRNGIPPILYCVMSWLHNVVSARNSAAFDTKFSQPQNDAYAVRSAEMPAAWPVSAGTTGHAATVIQAASTFDVSRRYAVTAAMRPPLRSYSSRQAVRGTKAYATAYCTPGCKRDVALSRPQACPPPVRTAQFDIAASTAKAPHGYRLHVKVKQHRGRSVTVPSPRYVQPRFRATITSLMPAAKQEPANTIRPTETPCCLHQRGAAEPSMLITRMSTNAAARRQWHATTRCHVAARFTPRRSPTRPTSSRQRLPLPATHVVLPSACRIRHQTIQPATLMSATAAATRHHAATPPRHARPSALRRHAPPNAENSQPNAAQTPQTSRHSRHVAPPPPRRPMPPRRYAAALINQITPLDAAYQERATRDAMPAPTPACAEPPLRLYAIERDADGELCSRR